MGAQKELLEHAKQIYLVGKSFEEVVNSYEGDKQKIKDLGDVLNDFLDTGDYHVDLAERHDVAKETIKEFLRGFEKLALTAWLGYVYQENPNFGGAAESVKMQRLQFEDYFWMNKGVDDNSEEAKARFRLIQAGFEIKYNEKLR